MQAQQRLFSHSRLPPTGVLRLLKNLEFHADGSRLSCNLENFEFDACPCYAALSYTWGPTTIGTSEDDGYNDPHRCKLEIKATNGSAFLSIGKNLFEGLCQFCQSELSKSLRYLWADAVCIDQDDPRERESQVALMGSVYSKAEKVIVWLGKDMTDFSSFAWFHSDNITSSYLDADESRILFNRINLDASIFADGFGEASKEQWLLFSRFYEKCRWFNRAWVFQETHLAQQVDVLCGDGRLSWESTVAFGIGLRRSVRGLWLQVFRDAACNWVVGDEAARFGFLRDVPYQDSEVKHESDPSLKQAVAEIFGVSTPRGRRHALLLHIINHIRPLEASDPRDKVYAAIGVVNRIEPDGYGSVIDPRYDLTVAEVYERATLLFLEQLPWLAILSAVEDRSTRKIADLPSWIPDFSSRHADNSLRRLVCGDPMPHYASFGQPLGSCWSVKASILSLRGGCLDKVAHLGLPVIRPLSKLVDPLDAVNMNTLETLEDALSARLTLESTYINGQGPVQALWRTLIVDQGSKPVEFGVHFSASVLWHLSIGMGSSIPQTVDASKRLMSHLADFENSGRAGGDFLVTPSQALAHYNDWCVDPELRTEEQERNVSQVVKDAAEFGAPYNAVVPHRRLYVTTKGYIGIGPESMQLGDEVWLLCDARTLFVLRPRLGETDRFTFMGETYLHSFMHGEALKTDHLHMIHLV